MANANFKNPVVRWIDDRLPIFTFMDHEYNQYPMPKKLYYFWNFGALATIMLVTMIFTVVVLAMQYTAHVDHAFDCVERIMRAVTYAWLTSYPPLNAPSTTERRVGTPACRTCRFRW